MIRRLGFVLFLCVPFCGPVSGALASDLPACPSDPSAYFHNCFGTYHYDEGGKYVGEWRDDKRHGYGSYIWPDGERYVGEYRDDKRHGEGTYTFADGAKEVGTFKNGKLNGYAVSYAADGTILQQGIWKDDEFLYTQSPPASGNTEAFVSNLPACPSNPSAYYDNCYGSYSYADGETYLGEWRDDKRHGRGIYTWADGDKYAGEFQNGNKHGWGTYTFADGTTYAGQYKDDKGQGWGTYTFGPESEWAGDKYVGEFQDGKRHGEGTYTFADGAKEVGTFRNGKLNGYAVSYAADGTILKQGIWKDDEFLYTQSPPTSGNTEVFASTLPACPSDPSAYFDNCYGTHNLDNGNSYTGEWKDGAPHGRGTATFISGNKYVGEFRDGEYDGQGTFTFADGEKYVGSYKDGKRHGQGTYTWPDGDQYVGDHRNGKSHGLGTYTFASGASYFGEYKDGKRHGQGTYTWPDGAKDVGTFRDGKLNGFAVSYDANGTVVKQGIWKDGEFQYASNATPPAPEAIDQPPSRDDAELVSASSGSGFSVSENGHIITNNHVIDGCKQLFVHSEGREFPATVVAYDTRNDLALLKTNLRPSTIFPLAEDRPDLLQDIYVAGYPFGMNISSSVKVTRGIISSLTGVGNNFSEIQIDAALQSGNSGGPILDDKGNVVGVAVAKLDVEFALENFGAIPENTNFGIKANVVGSILESNNVAVPPANKTPISKSELGRRIMDGTYYISCWMTMAQIESMRTKKVMFDDLQ